MAFLSELATNASAHNVSIIIYSGNDDSLVAHLGSEVTIQVEWMIYKQQQSRWPQSRTQLSVVFKDLQENLRLRGSMTKETLQE